MDKQKAQLIDTLSKRLQYLVYEAPDEDFNTDEINHLVSLLQIYDPLKITKEEQEKSYKKFLANIKLFEEKEEEKPL